MEEAQAEQGCGQGAALLGLANQNELSLLGGTSTLIAQNSNQRQLHGTLPILAVTGLRRLLGIQECIAVHLPQSRHLLPTQKTSAVHKNLRDDTPTTLLLQNPQEQRPPTTVDDLTLMCCPNPPCESLLRLRFSNLLVGCRYDGNGLIRIGQGRIKTRLRVSVQQLPQIVTDSVALHQQEPIDRLLIVCQ